MCAELFPVLTKFMQNKCTYCGTSSSAADLGLLHTSIKVSWTQFAVVPTIGCRRRQTDTLTAASAHVHVHKSMRAQRHTGLIVLSLAPRPHYPYNCMSETFSSAAQLRLHNADKHPSLVNSPSRSLFGQDGDVIIRSPIGDKILLVMSNSLY